MQLAAQVEAKLFRSVGRADSPSPMIHLQAAPRHCMKDMNQMERMLAQHVDAGRRLLASETTIGLATDKGLVKGYDLHNTFIFTSGSSAVLCCPQVFVSDHCRRGAVHPPRATFSVSGAGRLTDGPGFRQQTNSSVKIRKGVCGV